MKCLQCLAPAVENGEKAGTVTLRVCADGHRTGQATPSMIARSEKYHKAIAKAAKDGIFDYTSKAAESEESDFAELAVGE